MAMRAIWKGTISFGLVNIPIAVGLATKRSDPSFRTLDRESLQPVKQQLFSPTRGEVVGRDETVKGYEVSKDQYLPISDEELDSVAVERRRTIDILAFVDAEEVDPVYFDRSYYLEPQEHAAKPYSLLVQAMKEAGKAALGKIVMSSKEYLALLRPSGDALVIELLFYPEDVRDKGEIEDEVRGTSVTEEELQMARQLVESLSRPFEPDRYENEHKRLVLDLVQRKIDGEEVPVAAEVPEPAAVPDLMAALRASIDQAKGAAGGDGASADAASGEDGDASEGNGEPKKKPARKKSSTGGSGKGSNGAKGKGRAASKS
jgi:DNA end-binding protein Ku